MHPAGSLRRLTLGAVLAGAALVAVPAAANAATTCSYNPITQVATVSDDSVGPLRIFRSGQLIAFRDHAVFTGSCGGATVTNTNRIDINGRATASTADGFVIDHRSGGLLASGASPESDGHPEIEIRVIQQLPNAARLEVVGTEQADTIRVGGSSDFPGIMLGPDADNDHRMERADDGPAAIRIDVDGAGGSDFITGRGGLGISSLTATNVPLLLLGRSGNDTLVDGLARDVLVGGADFDAAPDNDTLFSVDGVQEQTINGGAGFDTATVDVFDRTSVEQRTNASVGRLRLDPAAVQAKAGGVARIGMSWTHPKDWRKLRSLELRVLRGSKPVGRIVMKPAADSVRAHGKLALAAGSRIDHHGKTVTAKLAVRLPESLAGERLRVDVAATDGRGREQLEPAAGGIEVR